MRRLASPLVVAASLVLSAVAAGGCGATSPDTDTTPTTKEAAARSDGPVANVKAALGKIGLRPDQKVRVDRAMADVEAKLEPARDAKRALARDLAAGVRTGTIDHARTDASIDALGKAVEAARPTIEAAADTIHATLDATQRQALVEALRDARSERRGERKEKLEAIADEIGLSGEQRDRIKDTAKQEFKAKRGEHKQEFREMHERMTRAAEAFESDQFDAKQLGLGERAPDAAKMFAKGMVHMTELTLPVLDTAQREKLAGIIERKASEME